jgi:hypothetical protein
MQVFRHQTIAALAQAASASADPLRARIPPPLHLLKLPEHVLQSLADEFTDAYPLTAMQQLMIQKYAGNGQHHLGIYHAQMSFIMQDSAPSARAMRCALQFIVQSHPVLRTVFLRTDDGQVVQAIRRNVEVELIEHHIAELSEAQQETYVREEMLRDRARPFAVGNDAPPPHRFQWFHRGSDRFELLVSIHHAIDDGWGNQFFLGELADAYVRSKGDDQPVAQPRANDFKELVALEHETRALSEAVDFWNSRSLVVTGLDRWPAATALEESPFGLEATLDTELLRRLQALSRDVESSLNATLLSAYLDLIGAEAGMPRATVGVVSNGRSDRLSDPLHALGLHWNMVPFCLPEVPQAREACIRLVQRCLTEIAPYTLYPLSQIAASRNVAELFFATFNFTHLHDESHSADPLGMRSLGSRGHDKFHWPLNFHVSVESEGQILSLRVEHDSAYFSPSRARGLIERYIAILGEYALLTASA